MNNISKNYKWYLAGCLGGGLLLIVIVVILGLLSLGIYTMPVSESLYYYEEGNIYFLFNRNNEDNTGCVYLGRTKEDVLNHLDGFEVDRGLWQRLKMIKDKTSDSIFVSISAGSIFRVVDSCNFCISPLVYGKEYKEAKNELEAYLLGRDWDKRFRDFSDRYTCIFFNWNAWWHEENHLLIVDGYSTKKIDISNSVKVPPIR
ncbi:MAG: hypothetical protein K6E73_02785 [Bacteroidales bacterium]|nr:hypothetical protein [Bacteroidales bacterium]